MNLFIKTSFINNSRRFYSSVNMYKVYVTQPIPDEALEILKQNKIDAVVNKKIPLDRKTLLDSVKDIDGLYCTLNENVDKELLDHASEKLKVIATCSVGFDHVDVKECLKRGIKLGYTPGVKSATAEFTVALLLNLARRVPEGVEATRNGEWSTWQVLERCGKGLKDSTVGIFGLGHIGHAVAERLCGFEVEKIIYSDVHPQSSTGEECKYEYVEFDQLLKQSDFLICSAAATKDTSETFDKDAFSKMKRDALFINISRGSLVNQDDLYDALQNKVIKAAALDVTTPEPLPPDHKLYKLKNCLITPHMCSAEIATRIMMATMTSDNIVSALKNEAMPSEIIHHHHS